MTTTKNIKADKNAGADCEPSLAKALFRPMDVPGVYARTELYEHVLERLGAFVSCYRDPSTEVFRFPPVMSRAHLERHGYLKSFPHLVACACTLHGDEAEIDEAARRPGGGWVSSLRASDLVLSPAACYPVYPILAARGPVPPAGVVVDVAADCFRSEPSSDLDRMQSFRMREFVCFGSDEAVSHFRGQWMDRAIEIAATLGLPAKIDRANDPFFGRVGRFRAAMQSNMELKYELLVPLRSEAKPTACMSFNVHCDHFGTIWGITTESGKVAHTGCVAFGMDRLTTALFWTHGLFLKHWPPETRRALNL